MADHPPAIEPRQTKRRPKNKVRKCGAFFGARKQPSKTPRSHAFHHKLTSKKPRSTTHFFQNTPQKTPKIDEIPPTNHLNFFP
jgi:hypothetical protein